MALVFSEGVQMIARIVENRVDSSIITDSLQPNDTKGYSLNTPISIIATNDSIIPLPPPTHPINTIRVEKGVLLAKKPTSINQNWCLHSKTGNEVLNKHVPLFKTFTGMKRHSPKKIGMLDCILANLLNAHNAGNQIIYSRRKTKSDTELIKNVTDYMASAKLIHNVIGKANEFEGNSSWMTPTDKVIAEFDAAKVRVQLREDAPMLEIRKSNGKPLSLNRVKSRNALDVKAIQATVQQYNATWLRHDATFAGRYLAPYCQRIFNLSLELGGRFYGGSHILMTKVNRRAILIDDESTCEPDFKAMHYCLLYALAGHQLNPLVDDPYQIEGYDRSVIKLASLVLLNSESISSFKACITKSGNPKIKAKIQAYKQKYRLFELQSCKGEPIKPRCSKGFISGKFIHELDRFESEIPEGTKGEDLYSAITSKHRVIIEFFGSQNIGLMLQNLDSKIMAATLSQLSALDIPSLPVHDSLRCKVSDKSTVISAMKAAYKSVTGFDGVVCD